MYMLVAIAVTILVIALAWRGIGARTPGAESSGPGPSRPVVRFAVREMHGATLARGRA